MNLTTLCRRDVVCMKFLFDDGVKELTHSPPKTSHENSRANIVSQKLSARQQGSYLPAEHLHGDKIAGGGDMWRRVLRRKCSFRDI